MAVTAFDRYVSGRDLQDALKYAQVTPFEKVLADARNGDIRAINFIFYSSRKQIAAAFWKYFMGGKKAPPKKAMQRIKAGHADVFAAEVYGMLADPEDSANPLKTYDNSKFKNEPEYEQLNKLGYYIYRYCQNLAFKMLRENPEEYSYGNPNEKALPQEQVASSFDQHIENGNDLADANADFAQDVEISDTEQRFLLLLQTKYPKLYPVIKMRTEGKNTQDIAVVLGKSDWVINKYTALAKEVFKEWMQ